MEREKEQSERLKEFAKKIAKRISEKKISPIPNTKSNKNPTSNTATFLSLGNRNKTSNTQKQSITIHFDNDVIDTDIDNFTEHMNKALEKLEKNINAKDGTKKTNKEKDCSLGDCSISGGRKSKKRRSYKKKSKKSKSRKFRKNVYK